MRRQTRMILKKKVIFFLDKVMSSFKPTHPKLGLNLLLWSCIMPGRTPGILEAPVLWGAALLNYVYFMYIRYAQLYFTSYKTI